MDFIEWILLGLLITTQFVIWLYPLLLVAAGALALYWLKQGVTRSARDREAARELDELRRRIRELEDLKR